MARKSDDPLVNQLRSLRQRSGLTAVALREAPLVLEALGASNPAEAAIRFKQLVDGLGDGYDARALRAAYGYSSGGETLAARRLSLGANPSTLENAENRAIEELAARLSTASDLVTRILIGANVTRRSLESLWIDVSTYGSAKRTVERHEDFKLDAARPVHQSVTYCVDRPYPPGSTLEFVIVFYDDFPSRVLRSSSHDPLLATAQGGTRLRGVKLSEDDEAELTFMSNSRLMRLVPRYFVWSWEF